MVTSHTPLPPLHSFLLSPEPPPSPAFKLPRISHPPPTHPAPNSFFISQSTPESYHSDPSFNSLSLVSHTHSPTLSQHAGCSSTRCLGSRLVLLFCSCHPSSSRRHSLHIREWFPRGTDLFLFQITSFISSLSEQPYDQYHTRYMALECNLKHNTAFFDTCCHPMQVSFSVIFGSKKTQPKVVLER